MACTSRNWIMWHACDRIVLCGMYTVAWYRYTTHLYSVWPPSFSSVDTRNRTGVSLSSDSDVVLHFACEISWYPRLPLVHLYVGILADELFYKETIRIQWRHAKGCLFPFKKPQLQTFPPARSLRFWPRNKHTSYIFCTPHIYSRQGFWPIYSAINSDTESFHVAFTTNIKFNLGTSMRPDVSAFINVRGPYDIVK